MSNEILEGGCLCDAVRYQITAPLMGVIACHCRRCRRMSGHVFAATAVAREAFAITESAGLAWYQSSERSRRGFCRQCGSSLFFDHGPEEPIGVAAGSFDGDPAMTMAAHIYVDEAGRYYDIAQDADHFDAETWARGGWKRLRPEP